MYAELYTAVSTVWPLLVKYSEQLMYTEQDAFVYCAGSFCALNRMLLCTEQDAFVCRAGCFFVLSRMLFCAEQEAFLY